ncbi:nucleolar GTP-binding protein [Hamiltosporidium magnivora]|uniref:Nucleolar GTP-binding protein 2 n=1 Tax=Hamiltosporidium magnivora TaxID=148818 RepID=A0A4Q9LLF7_9MICR|nr:nucleolar GTP-binding protein [Hamiltosporidium magnivora]
MHVKDKSKSKNLHMLISGRPKRNRKGEIIKEAEFQKTTRNNQSKIPPDTKWFKATRVVTKQELQVYENCVQKLNPYNVLLEKGKIPFSLLNERITKKKYNVDSNFNVKNSTFCNKSIEELKKLLQKNEKNEEKTEEKNESESKAGKGNSKRIFNELYKVVDSSDILIHVLDARDPMGTMCDSFMETLKLHFSSKQVIFLLNKTDLIPTSVTASWLRKLSINNPTVAYSSFSIEKSFGKESLISLLRQYSKLYKNKKQISVGFIGYPNVGKSSIINSLRNKLVCKVAPVPGETKVWQYVRIMRRIYLIDCPGIVPRGDDSVLKGGVRIEMIEEPEEYLNEIISKGREGIENKYKVTFQNSDDLIDKLCVKYGKLSKGGVYNRNEVAKMILYDWTRGRISYFNKPEED